MKVKRYEAKDLQEAVAQVKKDLGPEAVILLSRRIPRWEALKSAIRRPSVEVMAAVTPNGQENERDEGEEKKGNSAPAQARNFRPVEQVPVMPRYPEEPPHYRKLLSMLRESGMEENLSKRILRGYLEEVGTGKPWSGEMLLAKLASALIKWVPISGPVRLTPGRPRVVALVGPPGSGKTTTLVKLAARHALNDLGQLVLVTLDTYKVGSVEQLSSYGRLLGVPVEVAQDVNDLAHIVDYYSKSSLICVDTAGRGPIDAAHTAFLREAFRRIPNLEVHLVLGATIRDHEMEAAAKVYYEVPFHRILFTKVDEGITLGSMLNLAWKVNCPISYIAMGQRIPEDLEAATPEKITDLILSPHW
jgi:flagellar biosynthesis protein FlhF